MSIFNLERNKKNKIYNHKKNVLNFKLETLNRQLERKIKQRPTKKQKQNIENLKDESKKRDRLNRINKLEEKISFIEKDIIRLKKNLDDVSFEYEDLKNEMRKRNLAKFYTNILGFAVIRFID